MLMNRNYYTFSEAREAVQRLQIKGVDDYRKRFREDSRLPSKPELKYKDYWLGWASLLSPVQVTEKKVPIKAVPISKFSGDIKDWLLENLVKDGKLTSARCNESFLSRFSGVLSEINSRTSFLSQSSLLSERIYCVLNDVLDTKKCVCGKGVSFLNFSNGYSKYCSSRCANLDPVIRERIIGTNLEKYGTISPSENQEVREKMKATCMEKFGVENAFASEEIKKKIRLQEGLKEKISVARKEGCLKRYGVESPFHSIEVQKKIVLRNQENYGVDNCKQIHISKDSLDKLGNKDWLVEQNQVHKKGLEEIALDLGVSPSKVFTSFHDLGLEIQRNFSSIHEREIGDLFPGFKIGDRKVIYPYELDLYDSSKGIAIEIDGIYWHSYDRKESSEEVKKHLNKTLLCQEKGIRLLHIFENEWLEKKEIWKSIIASNLGINSRIYARDCSIRVIDDCREFLNSNHLQGFIGSSVKLGLFYDNTLVSVMTFGKPRFNREYDWEMFRFCTQKGLTVVGGASRLFKYFIREFNVRSILTYSDLRLGFSDFYSQLGFIYLRRTLPNYYYFKPGENILYNRMKFQKSVLEKVLENYDNTLSESDNMFNNGYRRIWDCGNLVYEWKK